MNKCYTNWGHDGALLDVTMNYDLDVEDLTASLGCQWYVGPANATISYRHAADVPRHKVAEELVEFVRRAYGVEGEPELPHAEKVVFSGPATVMLWPDGTKTVTKCREGDSLDYVFGMLACIIRKLTGNRGHAVDDNEDALRAMAGSIESVEDLDDLIDYAQLMLDTLVVLRTSSALWIDHLGNPCEGEADEGGDDGRAAAEAERSRRVRSVTDALHEKIDAISRASEDGIMAVSKLLLGTDGAGRDE